MNVIEITLRIPERPQSPQLQNVLSLINRLSESPRILSDASSYADDGDIQRVYAGAFGLYAHDHDVIILNRPSIKLNGESQGVDEGMVLLHEIAHWTGHASRLNRDISKALPYIKDNPLLLKTFEWAYLAHNEEVIAELAACRIGVMLGYDSSSLELKFRQYASIFRLANFEHCNLEANKAIAFINDLAKPLASVA